jgi:hypothetical protein
MAVPRVLEKMTAPMDERGELALVVAMVSSNPDHSGLVYYDVLREMMTNGVGYRWLTMRGPVSLLTSEQRTRSPFSREIYGTNNLVIYYTI